MKALICVNHELTLYNFRREFLSLLLSEGIEVTIAMPTGQYDGLFREMGCRVVPMTLSQHGMNPLQDFKLPGNFARIIRQEKPDVVLTYTIKPNIYGGMAAARCHVPCISTVTGLGSAFENGKIVAAVSYLLYWMGTRKTNCIFFQNPYHSDLFARHGIAPGRHEMVAGSGVNLKKHSYEVYPEGDITGFLFVGRVTKDKGIDELILAMRRLKAEYGERVTLQLLGNVEDGYEAVVADCEREGILSFLGRHENVHDYVKKCSAVVLPSYHEGLANALLEAAACGRPVIASRISGCKETFSEGVNGLGFEARDAESLYMAMKAFMEIPRADRAEMGRNGRKKMEAEFDRDQVNREYLKKIREITMNALV